MEKAMMPKQSAPVRERERQERLMEEILREQAQRNVLRPSTSELSVAEEVLVQFWAPQSARQ